MQGHTLTRSPALPEELCRELSSQRAWQRLRGTELRQYPPGRTEPPETVNATQTSQICTHRPNSENSYSLFFDCSKVVKKLGCLNASITSI